VEKGKWLLLVLSGLMVWCTFWLDLPCQHRMKLKYSEMLYSQETPKFKKTGLDRPQPELQEAPWRIKLWDEWAHPQAPEPPINEGTRVERNGLEKKAE
jgi:hypothetical protein